MTGRATIVTLSGAALADALPVLARLRIRVFREWPYLYEGSLAYEERYLARFVAAPGAVLVAARDGAEIVGASTGAPLAHEDEAFREPFAARGFDVARMFYCAESVLLADYRGQGLGHEFFERREAQARALGMTASVFCAVVRADNDPRRPQDYRPLDPFWRKRGYAPLAGITTTYRWREPGETAESAKTMQFWMKEL